MTRAISKDKAIPWNLIIIFFLLTIAILGTCIHVFELQKEHVRKEKEHELDAIANLKVDQIVNWLNERRGNARVITHNYLQNREIHRWITDPKDTNIRDIIAGWMRSLIDAYKYDPVLLVDVQGKILLTVGKRKETIPSEMKKMIAQAGNTHDIIFSELYLGEDGQDVHLDIFIPLLLGPGKGNVPAGVLVLRVHAENFLYRLIQSWPTPSASAETLLVRREGEEVVFLNEIRHQRHTALKLRRPLGDKDIPAAKAARGEKGFSEGIDYRGVTVLAVTRDIPSTDWKMVAKVDLEEVYAPRRLQFQLITFTMVLLIVSAGIGLGLIGRRLTKNLLAKGVLCQKFRKNYLFSEIRATTPSTKGFGFKNRNLEEILLGQKGSETSLGPKLLWMRHNLG